MNDNQNILTEFNPEFTESQWKGCAACSSCSVCAVCLADSPLIVDAEPAGLGGVVGLAAW